MTGQENVVCSDHAALGLEQSANTPSFPRGLPVEDYCRSEKKHYTLFGVATLDRMRSQS